MDIISKRNREIYEKKRDKESIEYLANEYGLTKGTVRNIILEEKRKIRKRNAMPEKELELVEAISTLDISKYAQTEINKHLRLYGIGSIEELRTKTSEEILNIRGIGKRMVNAMVKGGLIK